VVSFAKQPERYAELAGVVVISLLGWFSFVKYVAAHGTPQFLQYGLCF